MKNLSKRFENLGRKVELCVSTGALSCIFPMICYADDELDMDWLNEDKGSAFNKVNESVEAVGASWNRLLKTIAVLVFITALAGVAFTLAFAKGQAKQEAKSSLLYVILGIFVFFAAASLIVLVAGVGKNAFS